MNATRVDNFQASRLGALDDYSGILATTAGITSTSMISAHGLDLHVLRMSPSGGSSDILTAPQNTFCIKLCTSYLELQHSDFRVGQEHQEDTLLEPVPYSAADRLPMETMGVHNWQGLFGFVPAVAAAHKMQPNAGSFADEGLLRYVDGLDLLFAPVTGYYSGLEEVQGVGCGQSLEGRGGRQGSRPSMGSAGDG
ncbi:hypothetical protein CF319_g7505 [Tilletia indica]|nr:hypothetical protein CF319_g7505 [Tilletia indica]